MVSTGIDQDRAVPSSAAERELVDTEDLRRLNRRVGECPYQAQQRHATGRLVLTRAQSIAGSATQRQPDLLEIATQPPRAPGIALHQ